MPVTVTPNLTVLWTAESTTSPAWSTTPTLFTDRFVQGTSCLGLAVSNTTTNTWITITASNFQSTGVYVWALLLGAPAARSAGGFRIVLGDGTNRRAYYVGGNDFSGFQRNQWSCYMIDTSNLPTGFQQVLGSATPSFSAITEVGVGFTTTQKALGGVANCFWDVARYGNGLFIRGGSASDPGTFGDILEQETSNSNAYGIIRELQPSIYGLQGRLVFGDDVATSSTYFSDTNKTIIYEDNGAGSNFYEFKVVGNLTGSNSFQLGEKLGSGDSAVGINGCAIQSSGPELSVDLRGTGMDTLNVYGTQFSTIKKSIQLGLTTSYEFISNTIRSSNIVELNYPVIRDLTVISTTSPTASVRWNDSVNIKNSKFIANTTGAAIQHGSTAGSPYSYNNLKFSNNTYDIYNTSGGPITVDAINGSDVSSFTGSTVSINNPVSFVISNLIADTEVRIYRAADSVELAGIESSTTEFTYNYNYGGDVEVYVVIHKESYEYILLEGIILDENNRDIPVQQEFDRNYLS